MINITNKEQCCGCGACANICPTNSIVMGPDEEGFFYPSVNEDKCINCSRCLSVCPFLNETENSASSVAYGVKSRDKDIRKNSSSGGVFYHLAENILEKGGCVVGVAMGKGCRSASHIIIENKADLDKIRGSKYIQADPLELYGNICERVKKKQMVLFSGTPCQVNALKLYLHEETEYLICVDVICHGVPSRKLWGKYVEHIEDKIGTISSVNFRDKRNGWKNYGISFIGSNGRELFNLKQKDIYLQIFVRNYALRPSCYCCKAKENYYSDVTLGDFWGIGSILPKMDDGTGTSLVICRTEKGQKYLDSIIGTMDYQAVDYISAIKNNPLECSSVERPNERDTFFSDLNTKSFIKIKRKYAKIDWKKELKNRIIRMIKTRKQK